MKINKDLTAAIAMVYQDAEETGMLDVELIKEKVVEVADRLIVLDEPFDMISDFLIKRLVDKLVDKLSDPDFRRKVIQEASERSVEFKRKLQDKIDARRK